MPARSILLGVSGSCPDALDGSLFASIPLDRGTLEWLKQRAQCFREARNAYPDLYETYEIDCHPQWYQTAAHQEYDGHADRDKLERLVFDNLPFDDDRRSQLDELEALEVPWLVLPTDELPSSGNLRTECDQLVMSLRYATSNTVELRWTSYLKHTDVELRTAAISSEDIIRWLDEADQADQYAQRATRSWI
jgi:hypothetical protein